MTNRCPSKIFSKYIKFQPLFYAKSHCVIIIAQKPLCLQTDNNDRHILKYTKMKLLSEKKIVEVKCLFFCFSFTTKDCCDNAENIYYDAMTMNGYYTITWKRNSHISYLSKLYSALLDWTVTVHLYLTSPCPVEGYIIFIQPWSIHYYITVWRGRRRRDRIQLPMQSVPITTKVVGFNPAQARCTRYNIMW